MSLRTIFLSADRRLRSGWRVAAYLLAFLLLMVGITLAAFLCAVIIAAARHAGEKLGAERIMAEAMKLLSTPSANLAAGLAMFPAVMGITWLARRFLDRRSWRSLGFWWDAPAARDLLLGLTAGAALVLAMIGLTAAMGMLELDWTAGSASAGWLIFAVVGLSAAALTEELVCRGYIQNNLGESLGPAAGIAITSVLFAAFHLNNPHLSWISLANLVLAGVFLGLAYQRFRTLWAPWALHFAWNFFMGPVFGVPVSGVDFSGILRSKLSGEDWCTGGEFGFEGGLVSTAVMLAGTGLLLVWRGRPARPAEPVGRAAAAKQETVPGS